VKKTVGVSVVFMVSAGILVLAIWGRERHSETEADLDTSVSNADAVRQGRRSASPIFRPPVQSQGLENPPVSTETADTAATASRTSTSLGPEGASAPLAPRHVDRALSATLIDPERRGHPSAIDGCHYVRVNSKGLQFRMRESHFAAIADIDYDYQASRALVGQDDSPESSMLTPVQVRGVSRVFVDKVGQPIGDFFLAGTCDREGLCKIVGCESWVSSGPNLIVGTRFCGHSGMAKPIVIIDQLLPVEGNMAYDFDGAPVPLADLLAGFTPSDPTRETDCDPSVSGE
jgi:hypothetical protein